MSSTPSRRRVTGGGVALIIIGCVVALFSLGVLSSGIAGAVWADDHRDDAGYFTSSPHRYASGGYAITHEGLDVDGLPNGAEDELARVRITATGTSDRPVFVGIARERDVQRYLSRVPHSEVTDFEVDPFRAEYAAVRGSAKPAAPSTQSIWVASASGSGPQSLTWRVRDGSWAVVAMNADGSRGVEADVAVGVKVRFLGWITVGILVFGALLAALATTLIVLGARSTEPVAPSAPAVVTR
jgi:hypothetical protein